MTDIQKENKSGGKVPNRGSVNFPRLRFPEFEGEWESKPLREVVKINQGLQIAISERSTENKTGSYFYITNEFLKAGSGKKYYILNPPQSVICNEKDILMTRTGNTGQVVTNVSGAFHNNFFKVAYPEYIDKIFLYNFLKLNKTQNQILRFAGTSTIPDLNHSDFYRIIISLPSNKEQQKIASFLSLIDERITTQSKIIEGLEKLKVATAKKIFSQEFRFKDNNGNDFSKWEEMKLKNIVIIQMGQSPDSSSYNFENIGIPLIQGNADILNRKSNPRQYTSKPTKFCDVGDLLLTVRAPVGYVGKSKHYACIGRGICSVKNNDKSILEFIYQFLLYFEDKWKSIEQGSTFTAVNSSDINSINILLPSIPEQTKIANFLSAIDSKIDMENQLLQKLEEQKKFLLQNMFV